MPQTKVQNYQSVNDAALPVLGQLARTSDDLIFGAINQNFDIPLRAYATFPTPDAKLNFAANQVQMPDGSGRSGPPLKGTIPTVPVSSINFQSGATTGTNFNLTLPTTTIGSYRRAGFTLLTTGTIQVLFSAESLTLVGLANPGTLFVSGGKEICWIDLEATGATAFKTAGSATAIVENSVGGVARIIAFGAGSGGGSGSGNASDLLTRLYVRFNDSTFKYLNPNIFDQDAQTKVASATAAFNNVNSSYDFFTAGLNITSVQAFDADFLSENVDLNSVEVITFWKNYDAAQIVQVSRDGGNNYQNVAMQRDGTSGDTARGLLTFANESSSQVLDTYSVSNADTASALDNGSNQARAQAVTLTSPLVLTQLVLYLNKVGASTGGSFSVQIQTDNAGAPSGTVLCSSAAIQIAPLATGDIVQTLSMPFTPLQPGTYWMVLVPNLVYLTDTTVGYASGLRAIKVRTDTSSPTGGNLNSASYSGSAWVSNTNVKWTYQFNGRALDLRLKITSGNANVSLLGYGILYDFTPGVVTGFKPVEYFEIDGSADVTQFQLTRIQPDPDTLQMSLLGTGGVYQYKDFSISGQTISVPSGTFLYPGERVIVKFYQPGGNGFDNSDQNLALLVDNHLGSPNASLDKSVAGRGFFLRRPDGVLRELAIDNNDRITVWSV